MLHISGAGARRIGTAIVLAVTLVAGARAALPTRVAAASDLQDALSEIAERYQRETGENVQLAFGSSGNFARQIAQGAPFQIFLSADNSYVERLAKQGLTQGAGVSYARGRLALFTSASSHIAPDLADLRAAIYDGRLRHLAIANPEHAPYGRAAQESLTQAGLWVPLQKAMVLGENASQAAQFAFSGAAEAAVIPYALVLSSKAQGRGQFRLLPEATHAPLVQRMILLRGADAGAQRFFAYLRAPAAQSILQRYGFLP